MVHVTSLSPAARSGWRLGFWAGMVGGVVPGLVAVIVAVTAQGDPELGIVAFPAAVVLSWVTGAVLVTDARHRRLGVGLLLGSGVCFVTVVGWVVLAFSSLSVTGV
jgi:hypothetical protein